MATITAAVVAIAAATAVSGAITAAVMVVVAAIVLAIAAVAAIPLIVPIGAAAGIAITTGTSGGELILAHAIIVVLSDREAERHIGRFRWRRSEHGCRADGADNG